MGGKKDKKKKANKDPLKKAALAAKKDAKADKAALKRLQKDRDRANGGPGDGGNDGGKGGASKGGSTAPSPSSTRRDDLDSILESYRTRTKELSAAELEVLDGFPSPPRGNFSWTLCPANGMFYMFGGEYYDGAENIVFDELLRWDPDAKQTKKDDDDDDGDDDDTNNASNNTGQWTRILTPPPHPPPRCSHTAVHHDGAIYVFGGECATADKYHHYRDLWRFDVKGNAWEECRSRGGNPPTARSGHRAATWRHSMVLFGGFHEALRSETRWHNDVHLYDFRTGAWAELKHSKLARRPPPRSACSMAVCGDGLFVSGGYSRARNANVDVPGARRSEGIVHVDCWALPLGSLAGGGAGGANPPSWERVARKGEHPSARAGASAATHKGRMLTFGGVVDDEGDHHGMRSVFYDDLFALDTERRRWFKMGLKKDAGVKRRRRKKGNEGADDKGGVESDEDPEEGVEDPVAATKDEEAVSSGWDLDQLRQDMFAFIDGDGNVVFEKIEEEDGEGAEGDEATPAAEPTEPSEDDADATGDDGAVDGRRPERGVPEPSNAPPPPPAPKPKPIGKIAASSVMEVDDEGLPAAVVRPTPLPRINCAAVVRGNTLYIYGGMLEVGDREVCLDDCWSIDLNKRDKWTCIWAGQMHRQIWKGVDSDNDSYVSSDQAGDEDSDDDDDIAVGSFEPIAEAEGDDPDDEESKEARKKAKKAAKKAKEKEKRHGVRHEIAELKEKLGVDDERRTPLAGEAVADFYARTTEHWNAEAWESAGRPDPGEAMSTKEARREGFLLARGRYEELKPVLDRLNELEIAQTEGEEKRATKKADKKPKKDRLR